MNIKVFFETNNYKLVLANTSEGVEYFQLYKRGVDKFDNDFFYSISQDSLVEYLNLFAKEAAKEKLS